MRHTYFTDRRAAIQPARADRESSDTAAGQVDTASVANGYVSAQGGKWHRATTPEPPCYMTQTTACGMTFQPLNVTWHGEMPPTIDHYMCHRKGCRDQTP